MNNINFSMTDIYQFMGFIGIIITIFVGVIQRDRASQNQYHSLKDQMHSELESVKKEFSAEISDIKEDFVSKSVFERHVTRIEDNIVRIHSRLDEILSRLMAKNN